MGAYDDQALSERDERRKKRASKPTGSRVSFSFFDYNFSADERDLVTEDERPLQELINEMTTLIEAGYKLSISYKVEEEHWLATVAGTSQFCENYQTILTARASSFPRAIRALWWKLEFVNWGSKWKSSIGGEDFFD